MPVWPSIENLPLFNIRSRIFKHLIVLCCAFATTAAFGQTVRTWTGGNGTGTDLGAATNWSGGVVPGNGDVAQWDGTYTGGGSLSLTYNANIGGNYQTTGTSWSLAPGQTGNVTISALNGSSGFLSVDHVTNSSSAGAALILGDNSATAFGVQWRADGGNPPYVPHALINNSASPNVICPNVKWSAGGGNTHTLLFGGSGNWNITNSMICGNNTPTLIGKLGAGKLIWAGPSIAAAAGNNVIASPLDFEAGTVVLANGNPLTTQNITNNGTLKYDALSATQTLSGAIIGTGTMVMNAGQLTLSGASVYTGSTVLSNGVLVLGSAHNPGVSGPIGIGGTISFNGGTLRFSSLNTFDYSPRFNTAANQVYLFDTAGQIVTLATNMSSSGGTLTKLGSGTLTLSGTNSYSGATTVSVGKLVFQGVTTGSGNITVANGAALGVTDTGTQITPAALALGTSAGVTLEFNNVTNASTPIVNATTISAGGTVTVNVNGGNFSPSTSYPLLHWAGGTAPTFVLGTVVGAVNPTLSVSGNTLFLNVTLVAYDWTGASSGSFDLASINWIFSGNPAHFVNGGNALFDDTATGQTNVTLSGVVLPASVTVNNSSKIYSITSSSGNEIGGTNSLTKANTGLLTLSGGFNAYTGATTISGGTLSVSTLANGGSASDIGAAANSAANLVLNGGTLQYTNGGATSSDHLLTLTTSGGIIDASGIGALVLNNTGSVGLSGSGARVLTLTGTNSGNTLAASLGDNGGATSLTKSGSGRWILSGTNTYSGGTLISGGGTLQINEGGSPGSGIITDNGNLDFNVSSTLTVPTVNGSGSVTNDGSGTVILPNNNGYTGGTVINAGTLQVGNGGATGSLYVNGAMVDNGLLVFNTTGSFNYTGNGLISGPGNVIISGSGGLIKAIGANTYTGWTLINPGATFQPASGNQGTLVSSVVTNNGMLRFDRQDTGVFGYTNNIVGTGIVWKEAAANGNFGDVTLRGTNTYTGGTVISGGAIILGDGTPGAGSIVGDVFFTNSLYAESARQLTFNRPDNFTFAGNITYSTNLPFGNRGIVAQSGSGTVTLTGNNTYPGGTIINAGTVQAGAGGTSGWIGTGPCTDNGVLVFNRSDAMTFANIISGSGSVVQQGPGILTLTATNTYSGNMTVSNGTLLENGQDFPAALNVIGGTLGGTGAVYGPITLNAGTTLAPDASVSSVGIFTAGSDLTIGGNVIVDVNKSLAPQSNDLVVCQGTLSKTGTGTLTVMNLGPALAIGDKFTLFSPALPGGAGLTVTGAGATWTNRLALDGSIAVLTVAPPVNTNAPVMQASVSGSTLSLAWPTNLGWTLLTNSVGLTAANQWFAYPGSATITNVNITINPGKTNVFFRMVYTNSP